jgi:hypothetical protein
MTRQDEKICLSCGRVMTLRKKWSRNWDEVRYCSDACRRRKVSDIDLRLQQTILELLAARPPSASICPSEAARAIDPTNYDALMEPARRAARRLVARNLVVITQGDRVVDPSTARGPIRIRRV